MSTYINKYVRKARRVLAYHFLTSTMRDEEKDTLVALPCSSAFCVNFWATTPYNIYGNPDHVYKDEVRVSNAK